MIFVCHYKGLARYWQMSYIRHKTERHTAAQDETRYNLLPSIADFQFCVRLKAVRGGLPPLNES